MKYRNSTNSMHLLNGLAVGGDDRWSVGVELVPNTTGAQAIVRAAADSTASDLTLHAKGSAGLVRIGSTTGGSTGGVLLGSTTAAGRETAKAFKGVYQSTLTSSAIASIAVAGQTEFTIPSSVANVANGDLVNWYINWVAPPALGVVLSGHRFSTAAASVLTLMVTNASSAATATLSGEIVITWADLT